jgi:hypothetical protein
VRADGSSPCSSGRGWRHVVALQQIDTVPASPQRLDGVGAEVHHHLVSCVASPSTAAVAGVQLGVDADGLGQRGPQHGDDLFHHGLDVHGHALGHAARLKSRMRRTSTRARAPPCITRSM